ncbi:MAG: hypothetical protein AAF797_15125 [Planctomycetota bacterium]
MGWYSIYGTGITIQAVEAREDGRVEFSTWFTVLWVPSIPLKSWSAIYGGESPADGISDESHLFSDLQRVPHIWSRHLATYLWSVLIVVIAIGPNAFMIVVT